MRPSVDLGGHVERHRVGDAAEGEFAGGGCDDLLGAGRDRPEFDRLGEAERGRRELVGVHDVAREPSVAERTVALDGVDLHLDVDGRGRRSGDGQQPADLVAAADGGGTDAGEHFFDPVAELGGVGRYPVAVEVAGR